MGCLVAKPAGNPRIATAEESPLWDAAKMSDGLKRMQTSLQEATEGPLRAPQRPQPSAPNAAFKKKLLAWEFDLFAHPYDQLPDLAFQVLIMNPVISGPKSNIDIGKLWRYVCELSAWYHPRPL